MLRNLVIHAGYMPTIGEVDRALLATSDLRDVLSDRLEKTAHRHPMSACLIGDQTSAINTHRINEVREQKDLWKPNFLRWSSLVDHIVNETQPPTSYADADLIAVHSPGVDASTLWHWPNHFCVEPIPVRDREQWLQKIVKATPKPSAGDSHLRQVFMVEPPTSAPANIIHEAQYRSDIFPTAPIASPAQTVLLFPELGQEP